MELSECSPQMEFTSNSPVQQDVRLITGHLFLECYHSAALSTPVKVVPLGGDNKTGTARRESCLFRRQEFLLGA